jgi:hypothetical protein
MNHTFKRLASVALAFLCLPQLATADPPPPGTPTGSTALKSDLTWIDVTKPPYSAAGDAECRFDAAVTSGSTTVTITSGSLPAISSPKYCRLEGAGVAGADLITTITARPTSTTFTLGTAASTTVSAKAIFWGTDDTAAINAAINAATTSTVSRTVYLPPLKYLASGINLKRNVLLKGAYRMSVIERMFTVAELGNRQLTGTVIFPATTATPVIQGDATDTVFGAGVEGIVLSGSARQLGTGMKFGVDWGGSGFSSSGLNITRCHVAGFDTPIKHSNAVQGRIDYCSWNDCTNGVEIWKHDGIVITGCDSNEIDGNNLRIGSGKNVIIESGNYNNILRFADITDSTVYVDAVNVEVPNAEVFAVRMGVEGSRLIAGHVKVLNSVNGVLVRDYYPESNKQDVSIEIQSTTGNTVYYDSANSNIPRTMPVTYLRRYTDNTFATLQQTLSSRRVYLTAEERKSLAPPLNESFASRWSASPYCDLGWVATTSGGWNAPGSSAYALNLNQVLPGGFRLSSSSQSTANIVRFDANTAVLMPGGASFWELRGIIQSDWPDTGIYRWGIYSQDATVKPQYGVGILSDATTNANIQLEVITAGVSTYVSTGIPVSNANPALSTLKTWKEVILQYRPTLGLSVIIKDLNGVALAPEVFAGTVSGSWPSYHRVACYAGSNTNQWIDINFGRMSFMRYPNY